MNRTLALGVLVGVVVLTVGGFLATRGGGSSGEGCDVVREAVTVVATVEGAGAPPTADGYQEAGQSVRRSAVAAPSAVAVPLHRIADAYGRIAVLVRGFDPGDPSTYTILEEHTVEIEREEADVESARAQVQDWLATTCRPG